MANVMASFNALSLEKQKILVSLLRKKGINLFAEIPIGRVDRSGLLPLSYAQQRLWFLAQWSGNSSAYNVFETFVLRGTVHAPSLQRAVTAVVARHESLRTTFVAIDGQPRQQIHETTEVVLNVVDASSMSDAGERDRYVREQLDASAEETFDLERGPLVRVCLVKVRANEHVLGVTAHHIVSDGWSMQVLIEELAELYEADRASRAPRLRPLEIQYADWAVWHRRWLDAGEQERQLAYWRSTLGDEHPVLELPTDRVRPAVQSFRGATSSFELDAELVRRLRARCQAEGVTLFMALMAAYAVVLHRWSGQRAIRVGVPNANRHRAELEGLVGLFVNTHVFAIDVRFGQTFAELLAAVRDASLGAHAHADLPFEQLVEALNPERSTSHGPLFQVMFNHQLGRAGSLPVQPNGVRARAPDDVAAGTAMDALTIEPFARTNTIAQFDVALDTFDSGDSVHASWTYNVDLFDASTAERMAGAWRGVLEQILDGVQMRVDALNVQSAEEQRTHVVRWNEEVIARMSEPTPTWHGGVEVAIAHAARRRPDAIVAVCGAKRLTFAELDARATQLAHRLRRLGVRPEVRVGIALERSVEWLIAEYAVMKTGGAFVPLDIGSPEDRLRQMAVDADLAVLVTDRGVPDFARGALRCVEISDATLSDESTEPLAVITHPDNAAYVIYTSGSTGKPKGVVVTHGGLAMHCEAGGRGYEMTEQDVVLHFASMSFDASLEQWIVPAMSGATTVVSDPDLWTGERTLAAVKVEGITRVYPPTSHVMNLVDQVEATGEKVRLTYCCVGGEAVPRENVERIQRVLGCRIMNGYGPTETIITPLMWLADPGMPCPSAYAPIGKAVGERTTYILDASMNPVPVGVVGELYIGGKGVARGYHARPDLTAERFVPDPFGMAGARLYRTGDRARHRADGLVEYVGRVDTQVKLRGFRIELGEIEAHVLAHPSVSEAVVVVREDAVRGKELVAYVTCKSASGAREGQNGETAALASALDAALRGKLPHYMVPQHFVVLDRFPRTTNGKVDHRALPSPTATADDATWLAPRSDLEKDLAALWQELLGVRRVGLRDDFFRLGGHSLLATQVISRVKAQLGRDISLRVLFEASTLEAFALRVASLGAVRAVSSPAVSTPTHDSFPPTSGQRRLWFLWNLDRASAAYNLPVAVELRGILRMDVLRAAFDALVARHPSLRTRFPPEGGALSAVVDAPRPLDIPVDKLSFNDDASVRAWVEEEAARPFDLEHGPVVRVRLAEIERERHILVVTMHHIVSDGWSMKVLVEEFAHLVDAFSRGRAPSLVPMQVQFADYAAWQERWLASGKATEQIAYWKRYLGDEHPVLDWANGRPRPSEQDHRGAVLRTSLESSLVGALERVARDRGVTLNVLLLAAFQVLLHRTSGQPRISVGGVSASRSDLAWEPVIGFFANTHVSRVTLAGKDRFEDVLARVREGVIGALANQELPFERLVDVLNPPRSLAHSPLFQVMFLHGRGVASAEEMGLTVGPEKAALRITPFDWGTTSTQFDLTLATEESAGKLEAAWTYATQLFEASEVAALASEWRAVLEAVATDSSMCIGAIKLRSATTSESDRLACEGEEKALPDGRLVHARIEAVASSQADQVAVTFEGTSLTYAELNGRANQLARHLRALRVGQNTLVGVHIERSLDLVVTLLGVMKAGGAYVPLEPEQPSARLVEMIRESGLSLVVTQTHHRGALEEALASQGSVQLWDVDGGWSEASSQATDNLGLEVHPSTLAYCIYTSGSTGKPKGAGVPHAGLRNRLEWMAWAYGVGPSDVVLQKTPYGFDVSVWEFFLPLMVGAKLAVARPGAHRDPSELLEVMVREGVTTVHFVPSMLRAFVETVDARACKTLRQVMSSGEALSEELAEKWRSSHEAALHNLYGPTEASIDVTSWSCAEGKASPSDGVPIGRAIWNTRLYVLDGELSPVRRGGVGELYIGGVCLARGYVNRADLTSERFLPDPFETGARMYRTGDVARHVGDGVLEYLGRMDAQVKIRGVRIEVGEVESVLRSSTRVREAAVLARKEPGREARLEAYVVLAKGEGAEEGAIDALRGHAREHLPEAMVPSSWVVLETMPLTSSGKLDRKALLAIDSARPRVTESSLVAPSIAAEITLVAIWQTVLGLERVGIRDNFFDLGGDSILSLQVVQRARESGLAITARDVFQHQTIEALARAAGARPHASLVDERPLVGDLPLTPVQARFFEEGPSNHYNQAILLEPRRAVDAVALRHAVDALVAHHDALRLRFREEGGAWKASYGHPPSAERIVWVTEAVDSAAVEAIAERAQASLRIDGEGELLRVVLLHVADGSTRLLLVLHHLVVDGVSWRILLEDLQTAYLAFERGERPKLPAKTSSYRTWAERLVAHAEAESSRAQGSYWVRELGDRSNDLPRDIETDVVPSLATVQSVTSRFDATFVRRFLKEAPTAYRTRVDEILLAALARAVQAWCGQDEVLVELEGHGREDLFDDVDVSRTVGWFTTLFPVRLRNERDLARTLLGVKRHLRAVPERGLGYGLLRHHASPALRTQMRDGAHPRITFNYLGQFDTTFEDALFVPASESSGAAQASDAPIGNWLAVTGQIYDGELTLTWSYSRAMYRPETIARLARAYETSLHELVEHCVQGPGALTAEDFPLAGIDDASLAVLPVDPRNVEDIYRLSPMQAGMLFHHLVGERNDDAYVNQLRVEVRGLDVDRFRRAWESVVRRHDVLRASIHWDRLNEPVQVVHRQVISEVACIDGREWSETERSAHAESERRRGFELVRAPLTRVLLVRTGDDLHELVWTTHHSILDGWSLAAMMGEVLARYAGQDVAAQGAHYRDFIAWLSKRDKAESERFWRAEVGSIEEPTRLLPDRPVSVGEHVRHGVGLHGAEWDALREFARRERVTVNTLLQGAWALVVARRTGKRRVMFGTTVSGRPASLVGAESVLGLFINTLPLAVDVPGGVSVGPWLRALQEKNLRMREHEEVPLYEIQKWIGQAGEAPFDTLLVFENYPIDRVLREGVGDLAFGEIAVEERTSYALTLTVVAGASLEIAFGHAQDPFLDATVAELARELLTVLSGLAVSADQALGRVGLLDDRERCEAALSCEGEAKALPDGRLVHARIEAVASSQADQVAVTFEGTSLTYAELNGRANQLARHLRALGVGQNTLVGVHIERSLDLVVTLLGVMKAGGAYVPLEPEQPSARLVEMIRESGLSLVVTQTHHRGALEEALASQGSVQLWDVDGGWSEASSQATDNLGLEVHPSTLAYCIYTSGSTGKPKGAGVPHAGLRNRLEWMAWAYEVGPRDVVLQKTPYGFDVSVWEFFLPLMVGAKLAVARPGAHRDPSELLEVMIREGVTTVHFVPSMLRAFVETVDARACKTLRQVMSSGEALSEELAEKWRSSHEAALHNLYGPTEASIDVTSWSCAEEKASPSDGVPIGRAIWNTRLYVLDGELSPVRRGSVGELYIGGVCLARGYVNRADLTSERFLPDPFETGARMYRTGDVARHVGDGVLEYLGRVDAQVKIRGVRIEVGEVESVLRSSTRVREAAVLARKEPGREARLEAYVVLAKGEGDEEGAIEALRAHAREHLPEAMVPSSWVVLETMPLTSSGKLDRKALFAIDKAATLFTRPAFVPPVDEHERLVASVWEEVLGLDAVGRHDDFFALGGHSLLAVQVSSRLSVRLGQSSSPRLLFEGRTVEGYARLLAELEPSIGPSAAPALSPVGRAGDLPLSYAQQRFWLLWRMAPESSAYTISTVLRLHGLLDVDVLGRAFETIVLRHEALRTTFTFDGRVARQRVSASSTLRLERVDLTSIVDERESRARELAEDVAAGGFDLEAGPLMRVRLVALAEQEHVLALAVHHIVSDGGSMQILVEELAAVYEALLAKREPSLRPLPIQYADWAVWQRRWFEGGEQARQLAYWKNRLGDQHPVLELPTDRLRPAVQSLRGATVFLELAPSLVEALRVRCQERGVTTFMALLAAFQVVLHRWSGQHDIRVGVPSANRNRMEVEGLIGLFVNTHVLTTELRGDLRFDDVLLAVREASLDAQAHADLSFEQLVEELNPDRSTSHSPLFQVMFNHQHAAPMAVRTADASALQIEPFERTNTTSLFDIALDTTESEIGISAAWTYSVDLFNASTAERMANAWSRVLEQVASGDDLRVDELRVQSPDEERTQIEIWNGDALARMAKARAPWRGGIEVAIAESARRVPSSVAVVCGPKRLTYAALDARANQLAHRLRRQGARPEARIGIAIERSVEWIVAELAVLKTGGAFVPLDLSYPEDRLRAMAQDAQLTIVLTHDGDAVFANGIPCIAMSDPSLHAEPTTPLDVLSHPENAAYMIYTSGSTGTPKGVVVAHGALRMHAEAGGRGYAMRADDTVLHFASMSFDASIEQWVVPLMYGAKVVLSDPELWTGERTLAVVKAERVTRVYPPTSHVMNLVDRVEATGDPVRVELCAVGGEAVPRENVERIQRVLGSRIMCGYGPTETVITPLMWLANPDTDCGSAYAPIGTAVGDRTSYVLDESLRVVPIGVIGELFIGGDGMARGYHARPDLTADRFVPDPFGLPGSRLYRTGDRVRCRPDGVIEYVGRVDTQVKVRGFRIELGEIEAQLLVHPAVSEAVVVVREDHGNKRLVAYVVAPRGEGDLRGDLRAHLAERLPDYMVPSQIVMLEAFPRTRNGKVDRKALPAPTSRAEIVLPRTPIEKLVATLWSNLLGVPQIGIHDNFFELGASSLLVVRFIEALDRATEGKTSVALAFRHQTVATLAHAIESGSDATQRTIVPIGDHDEGRALYCIHPAGGHVLSYRSLAKELGAKRRIRGIQARSFLEDDWIDESIDVMADEYVRAIESDGFDGPLELIGWSFGVLVAIEVARRWIARGGQVGFLGLIDGITVLDAVDGLAPEVFDDEATARAALAAWVEASALSEKWRRLLAHAGGEADRWLLGRFVEGRLAEKTMTLAEERELFNAANCMVLMRDWTLRPIDVSVTAFWARESTEREGFDSLERMISEAFRSAEHLVLDGTHDDIVASPELARAVAGRLPTSPEETGQGVNEP